MKNSKLFKQIAVGILVTMVTGLIGNAYNVRLTIENNVSRSKENEKRIEKVEGYLDKRLDRLEDKLDRLIERQ